jgi:hypothetical protein
MPDTHDISALIQRWQAGDERAAEALYDRCRESVFRLAYGLLGDPADAEEAAQDALAYALNCIARYDPHRGRFRTWLHTITVSRCRDASYAVFGDSLYFQIDYRYGGDRVDGGGCRPLPFPPEQVCR